MESGWERRECFSYILLWLFFLYVPDVLMGELLGEESLIVDIIDLAWEILLLPLSIGFARYYNNLSQNKKRSIKTFFSGYSPFLRNLRACILMCFVSAILIVIACIPLTLCLLDNDIVAIASIIATVFWGLYLFYKSFGTMVFYDWRIGEDHETGVVQILRDCYKRMKSHNDQFFTLNVRFTGWVILCICTLGFASFWIVPYILSSYGIFYHKYVFPY